MTTDAMRWLHEQAEEAPARWLAVIGPENDLVAFAKALVERFGDRNNFPVVAQFDVEKRRVVWSNGSWATLYPSDAPTRLRGFSGGAALFISRANFEECWPHLQFGMRETIIQETSVLVSDCYRITASPATEPGGND